MMQITPQMRIFVALQTVDFRKGIDGLAGVCRRILGADPFNGHLFVFRNRRRTSIKILLYDGQGYWLCQKRLSKGTFQWWPEGEVSRQLMAHLSAFISRIDTLSRRVELGSTTSRNCY